MLFRYDAFQIYNYCLGISINHSLVAGRGLHKVLQLWSRVARNETFDPEGTSTHRVHLFIVVGMFDTSALVVSKEDIPNIPTASVESYDRLEQKEEPNF